MRFTAQNLVFYFATAHQAKLLRCAAAFWERICFDLDLFRGMVEGVFPEVGFGLAGDPLAQEIAQDGTAGAHEHKGQHHHAAPRLRVAEQQKKAEDQQKQADSQEKGKDFLGFHPCLPHRSGPGVASETRTRERGRKGMWRLRKV